MSFLVYIILTLTVTQFVSGVWIANLLESRGELTRELKLCEEEVVDLKNKNRVLTVSKDISIESVQNLAKEKDKITGDFASLRKELEALRVKKCIQKAGQEKIAHEWEVVPKGTVINEDVDSISIDPGVVRVFDVARCKARRDPDCTPKD